MKNTLLLTALLTFTSHLSAEEKVIKLFNGKDLKGWHSDVPAADKDPKIKPRQSAAWRAASSAANRIDSPLYVSISRPRAAATLEANDSAARPIDACIWSVSEK